MSMSVIKAVRVKCLDCCGDSASEVKLCPVTDCSLYPFRLGKNPYNKRVLSDEQKAAAADRLKQARLAKNRTQDTL